MQTIQFKVSDNYLQIILSLLQSFKKGMIEDLLIIKDEYKKDKKKKNLSKLLKISVWDIKEEDIKVKDWKIQTF